MIRSLIVTFVGLFLLCSCGTSRTVVKVDNRAEGVTTSVTVSGNQAGETSINVQPNITVPINGKD